MNGLVGRRGMCVNQLSEEVRANSADCGHVGSYPHGVQEQFGKNAAVNKSLKTGRDWLCDRVVLQPLSVVSCSKAPY